MPRTARTLVGLIGLGLACLGLVACDDSATEPPPTPGDIDSEALDGLRERLGVEVSDFDAVHGAAREGLDAFWGEQYPTLYGSEYRGPDTVAAGPGDEIVCDGVTRSYRDVKGRVLFCPEEELLVYDVGRLRDLHAAFGDDVVGAVLARSWGRAVQARTVPPDVPEIMLDLQADCFAGAWLSRSGSTSSDGLAPTLAGYVSMRERTEKERVGSEVATAPERIAAVEDGAAGGAGRCAAYVDEAARPDVSNLEIPTTPGSPTADDPLPELVEALNASWSANITGFEPVTHADSVDTDTVWMCEGHEEPEVAPTATFCEATRRARFDEGFAASTTLVVGPAATRALLADAWARAGALALGFTSDPTVDGVVLDCLAATWPGETVLAGPGDPGGAMSHEVLDQTVATLLVSGAARDDGLDPFARVEAFGAGFTAASGDGPGPADACSRFL